MRALVLLSGLVLLASCASPERLAAPPAIDPLAELAGRWMARGPRDIIGRGGDEILHFERGPAGWTMTLVVTRYPSVNEREKHPQAVHYPPVPVRHEHRRLVYADPRQPERPESRMTFALRDEALCLPALVARGERGFEIEAGPRFHYRIEFDQDPRRVPHGSLKALGFARWPGSTLRYTAGEEPDRWRQGQQAFMVHLIERRATGEEEQLGSLIWNDMGQPWFFGTEVTRTLADRVLERVAPEEWQRILELERVEPQPAGR